MVEPVERSRGRVQERRRDPALCGRSAVDPGSPASSRVAAEDVVPDHQVVVGASNGVDAARRHCPVRVRHPVAGAADVLVRRPGRVLVGGRSRGLRLALVDKVLVEKDVGPEGKALRGRRLLVLVVGDVAGPEPPALVPDVGFVGIGLVRVPEGEVVPLFDISAKVGDLGRDRSGTLLALDDDDGCSWRLAHLGERDRVQAGQVDRCLRGPAPGAQLDGERAGRRPVSIDEANAVVLPVAPRRDRQVEPAHDLHEGIVAGDGVAELKDAIGERRNLDRARRVRQINGRLERDAGGRL